MILLLKNLLWCLWQLMLLSLKNLEGALKERLNKVKAKRLLLSSTRFTLDDAIMLFHDF